MPAPAVIPAPIAYNKVAAVETLVVGDMIKLSQVSLLLDPLVGCMGRKYMNVNWGN